MIRTAEREYRDTQSAARVIEARITRITIGAALALAVTPYIILKSTDAWITGTLLAMSFAVGLWFVIYLCESRNRLVGYGQLLAQEQAEGETDQPLHLFEPCAAKLHWLPMTAESLRRRKTSLGAQYAGVPVEGYETAAEFIDRYADPFGEYLYDRLEDNKPLAHELQIKKQLRGKDRRAKFRQDLRVGLKYAFTNAVARNWTLPILATRVLLLGVLLALGLTILTTWNHLPLDSVRWWLLIGLPTILPTLGLLAAALHGLHRVMFGRGTALACFWRFLPARWEYLKLLGIRARYVDARAMTGTSEDPTDSSSD